MSDSKSWKESVAIFYEEIYRFCVHILGDATEAADATQEIFIRSWKQFETVRDLSKVRGWLYMIARRECIDRSRWWRRFQRQRIDTELEFASGAIGVESALQALQAMQRLPQRQREVFALRNLHGFSTAETADLLGIEEGTVKSQLKRAVDFLNNELRDTDVLPSHLGVKGERR